MLISDMGKAMNVPMKSEINYILKSRISKIKFGDFEECVQKNKIIS